MEMMREEVLVRREGRRGDYEKRVCQCLMVDMTSRIDKERGAG